MRSSDPPLKSGVVKSYTNYTAVVEASHDGSVVIVDGCYLKPRIGGTIDYREKGVEDGVMHAEFYEKHRFRIKVVDGTDELANAIKRFREIDPGF